MKHCCIIPDSSFFICFLDDINEPDYLFRMIDVPNLEYLIGEIIEKEINDGEQKVEIKQAIIENVKKFQYYKYGEVLRPLFSIDEIGKGEHEVIAISYICNFKGDKFVAILDDDSPKQYLKRIIPTKETSVTGTIGYIQRCTMNCTIFEKDEAIHMLKLIRESKFWIENKIIDKVIMEIIGQ